MRRFLLALMGLVSLGACALTAEPRWASDEAVAKAHYTAPGPSYITIFTSLSNETNSGEHTGLLINGSERVLFDPAGTWSRDDFPERNDVIYGMTPPMLASYRKFHVREKYRLVEQTILVPTELADRVAAAAESYGAVPKAQCALSISRILHGIPEFSAIHPMLLPKRLSDQIKAKLPQASYREIRITDPDWQGGYLANSTIEPVR